MTVGVGQQTRYIASLQSRWPIIVLGVIGVLTLIASVIAPYDPLQTQPEIQFTPPNSDHFFGTDSLGRDVLSRVLYGGRQTLLVALLATLVGWIPGVLLGLLSESKWADMVIGVWLNALLAVPGLVIAMVVITLLGRGVLPVAVAIGFAQIAPCAVVTRAAALSVRSALYVEAARSIGATRGYILWNGVLPNIAPTLLAYAGVMFSYAVLNGAALNFLGLGVERSVPEWGVMLAEGREVFRSAPWIAFAPGVAITVTVWAVNRLVDTINRV